ncbi:MAG: SusC/RagA family TonB-linked outer membrane protein, partial [Gemmatimonadota bacterium]|nr:SusC/RagA family TonB-linked outer membrane protein [Gemmatimonadota bacterium]
MMIAVAAAPGSLLAQQAATVTGRVTGEGGAPVAAATVAIPSLGVSTQTGADGTYTLTVPASRVRAGQVPMTAQRVGLQTQTLAVTLTSGGTVTRNFQLGTDVLQLQEIVAIGIGQTTTRERLGTSIASVSGEALTRVQTPNIVTAIAAKAPNVEVTSSSGEPGAATYIRIRGVNTISGSGQPLFVVDGVPINNSTIGNSLAGTASANRASDINPNDVASMEILKGAAAAAIYGARAGNGVILITTKSGQAGQTRASLTSTITRDQVTQGVPLQTGFGQGAAGARSTTSPFSWGPRLAEGTPTFDHFGEMFRTGNVFDNNLSVSGGSERTTYFLSLGRLDHEGTIVGPNNFYNRTTARLKGTHQLISSLQVGGNFAYAQTDGAYIQKGSNISGLLLGALRTPPEFDNREFRSETGLHRSYRVQNPTTLASSRGYDNPFFVVNEHRNDSELGRIFGNVNALFTPLSWLSVNYTLGNDYWNDERLTGLPPSSSSYATGSMERGTYTYHEIDSNLTATATHTFSDMIGGSLTLGHNRNSRSFRQHNIFGFDFVAPDVFSLNNTVTRDPDEFRSLIHSESVFGQATADLFDQLYLTGALRYDGFSTFGESERRHLYPKASAAWEFTKALGIERGEGLLGFGKVRAAWGQAGNEPEVYQTITAFSAGGSFGDGGWGPYQNATFAGRGGLNTSTLRGQQALRPERTTEREVGLDLGLFRDMATVGITYYNALTTDAIFSTPLAPSTGFGSQVQNAATIRNEGIELNA